MNDKSLQLDLFLDITELFRFQFGFRQGRTTFHEWTTKTNNYY